MSLENADRLRSAFFLTGPLVAGLQNVEDLLEFVAEVGYVGSRGGGKREGGLIALRLGFFAKLDPGAGDGEAIFVEKLFDAHYGLDIALAKHALASAALDGFELRKFCLPEAQYVGGQAAEFGDFADSEVELVRNDDFSLTG